MLSDLKKARLEANLTIEQVSEQLNIRKKYLVALEENDLSSIPGGVYINGYLKLYSKFLKIDVPSIDEPNNTKEVKKLDDREGKSTEFGSWLVILSLAMLLAVIIIYPLVT